MADVGDACLHDLEQLLRSYEQGVIDTFAQCNTEEAETQNLTELTSEEGEAVKLLHAELETKISAATVQFLKQQTADDDEWYQQEAHAMDQQDKQRKCEVEAAREYFQEQGVESLEETLRMRLEQHLISFTKFEQLRCGHDALCQAEKAQQEWTADVCKSVILEMRREWRSGQKSVLQRLANDLRNQRRCAAEALERQFHVSRRVAETVKSLWSSELQGAQAQLDLVAEQYRKALKGIFESRLRDARQHGKEQAEYFQTEIRDALLFEQQESGVHRAQLRKMRLAMLKWRFDYQADAKKKAGELIARNILSKLSAAAESYDHQMTPTPQVVQLAEPEPAPSAAAQSEEQEMMQKDIKKAVKAASGEKRQLKKQVSISDVTKKHKDGDEGGEGSGSTSEAHPDSDTDSDDGNEPPPPPRTDPYLVDCRNVLEKIWGHLSTVEEASRDFCNDLEQAIPFEEEILIMYEEELARHGIVVALDATDGRAEEALLQLRDAQALERSRHNADEEKPKTKRRDTNAKPAVPIIRKRVDRQA